MTKKEFAVVYKKYGASAIASVFGVPSPSVRRWASKGPPLHLDTQLRVLEQAQRQEGYEEKSLREMMALAEEDGKLPKVRNYARRRDGEKTSGWEVSREGLGFLNEATLLKLAHHLETQQMSRGLPNWLASVTLSAFSEDVEKGLYTGKLVQVDHPDANQFVTEAIMSSGLQGSRKEMIEGLLSSLRQKMRESDAKFYLHGSYMSTYEYKTTADVSDRARRKRKKRKAN